jgi:hypothetical protein
MAEDGHGGFDRTAVLIALGLAIFLAALIGLVVVIGLLQKTLDPTGVVGILSGLFTGIISAVLILLNKKQSGGGGHAP